MFIKICDLFPAKSFEAFIFKCGILGSFPDHLNENLFWWILYITLANVISLSGGDSMIVTMTGGAHRSFWNALPSANKHLVFLPS